MLPLDIWEGLTVRQKTPFCVLSCNISSIFRHLEAAVFASCSLSPSACNANTLTEDLTVEAGDSFELDVSLDFRDGGPSGVQQKVTVLQLFKGAGTADQIYFCDLNPDTNPSRTCASDSGVTVNQDPVVWHNISLELATADSGEHTYTAQYNLIDPRNSGQLMITKVFMVTVNSVTSKCAISILIS